MAGNLSLAAKLFLATTVLATGGTGAYYGTQADWAALMPFPTGENSVAATDSSSSEFESDDLDAVASAWAEPAPQPLQTSADSSPTARSAEPTPVRADTVSTLGERYAIVEHDAPPLEPQHPAAPIAEKSEPTVLEQVAPVADAEIVPAAATIVSDEPTAVSAAPATEAPTPEPAIARGQEPNEEFAFDSDEPQQTSSQRSDTTVQTLGDAPRGPAAPTSNDRYGSLPTDEHAIVNPFGSQPATAAPRAAAPDTVEPLPPEADEIGGPLTEVQQDDADETSRGNSMRSAHGNLSSEFRGIPASRAADRQPEFGARELPSEMASQPSGADGTGRPGERALEGAQRPALEIQKFAPSEIQVGKPAKFVIQIRNVGTQAADGVEIRDEVPKGTRLISTTPTAESDGSHLVWQLDKLSPGEDRTVEMQLMPQDEGEIGSVATVSYSAQASVKTRCTMPQLAIRMTTPDKVMIGHEQRVKIELRNPGSGDATGVMLFENVPQNVKHAAGPALEFEVGTLKAGETRELELVLLAEKAGKTVNVLSARADGNLQVQQQVEFEVIAPALTVDVNGPERRYLERPATYEVSVENPGTAPAHDVQIITKLPKGLRFVRANNMGEYDSATHSVYWSLAELPEGERGTVELVAMPIEAGSQTLEVESRSGSGLSDSAQQQIVVDGLAAIMFEVRDLEDPIEVGGETGYEIRVVNQGTKAATNVQIAVNLPASMQFVSAEGETQHTAQHGRVAFDPIAELAPKADTVYRVRVQGMQPGDQRVTVEVNTDDVSQPIRREESTRVFGDE